VWYREFLAWMRHPDVTYPADIKQLQRSLAALRFDFPDPEESSTDAPIFLLSTGWRSGSTLLQRILVSDPQLLLWGEPFGEMTLVSRITEMVSSCLSQRDLQLWHEQADSVFSQLSSSWIATLSPASDDFRRSLRGLFDQWFGESARRRGFARWGLKETRLGASEALMLYSLFPRAKFVFLSRNPYDCYRSFADSRWQRIYYRYPEICIDSIAAFARHWNRIAVSWADLPSGFPCYHVKYEDLISGRVDFRKLESWLGIQIREEAALSASVGGTAVRSGLNWLEHLIVRHEAGEGMNALGYAD
jgi:hypothetical protein